MKFLKGAALTRFIAKEEGVLFASGIDTIKVDLPWRPDQLFLDFEDPSPDDPQPTCSRVDYDTCECYVSRLFRWWTRPQVSYQLNLYWNVSNVKKVKWTAWQIN